MTDEGRGNMPGTVQDLIDAARKATEAQQANRDSAQQVAAEIEAKRTQGAPQAQVQATPSGS